MPARTERYRFLRWEIEDVDGVARTLPGGLADVNLEQFGFATKVPDADGG